MYSGKIIIHVRRLESFKISESFFDLRISVFAMTASLKCQLHCIFRSYRVTDEA